MSRLLVEVLDDPRVAHVPRAGQGRREKPFCLCGWLTPEPDLHACRVGSSVKGTAL